MSDVFRANRKAKDADIIRYNSVGLSLSSIARKLNCNPSTVTQRLASLGIEPADTRRAFMEDVYNSLSKDQQSWLENQAECHENIKTYVRTLILKEYKAGQTGHAHAA